MKSFRLNKIIYIVFTLILCLSLPLLADTETKNQKITVSASIDRNIATIAEKINYNLEIKHRKDISFELNIPKKQIGIFTIEKSTLSEAKEQADSIIQTLNLMISTLETGIHLLPEIKINYYQTDKNQKIKTINIPSMQIHVKSLLTEDKITDLSKLKDIKNPVLLKLDKKKVTKTIIIIFTAFLIIVICSILIYIYIKRKNKPVVIIKTPYEIAITELSLLQEEHLIEHKQVKEYYFKLSIIIRKYLEGRFHLHAPTQTTEEFFRTVSQNKVLKTEYKKSLKTFLDSCDFVKFAKHIPEKEEIEKTYTSAKNFVESSRNKEEENAD